MTLHPLRIELMRMAPTGEAIGKHEGLVVFVPYGMPGDLVEVEIVHKRRSFSRGRILNILRPSPARTAPECKYFQTCGGCEWQHISYEQQLLFKTQAVHEQLTRIGKFAQVAVESCIPSPTQYHYRNHTQFVVSPHGVLGYREAGSQTVIEVDHCPVIATALSAKLDLETRNPSLPDSLLATALNEATAHEVNEIHLRAGANTGEVTAFVTNPDGVIKTMGDTGVINERIGAHAYRISPGSFFQINTKVTETLVSLVLKALGLGVEDDVLDLYCGVGLFTAPIAAQCHFVMGIEANPSATADALVNLKSFPNAVIMTADMTDALARPELNHRWDAIVVDPPRAGVEYESLLDILKLKPARLVYVSCDPATLARDARIICDRGYTLGTVQPLDMFPQTHHVETVALFTRTPGA